jgi:hypothetical protein
MRVESIVYHLDGEKPMEVTIAETPNINELPTPSQAEGGEHPGDQGLLKTTPSQAEGDEETIDQDIKDKLGSS